MLETLYDPAQIEERCGLILKDGSIVEIENVAEEKTDGYEMNPDAVLPFLKDELIAGTWHTHPKSDPNLSGDDYLSFLAYPQFEHSIIGVRNGEVTITRWRIDRGVIVSCD